MEEERITFSVQMTVKEVYRFTMYHVYHSFSGIFGICLSLVAMINLLLFFDTMADQTRVVMSIIAAWYILLEPVIMLSRAKGQVKRNKSYQQPLDYQVDETGITVSQNEESQTVPWEGLMKVVETKSQYLVYSSKIYAFIFPKAEVGEQCDALEKMILKYSDGTKIRLKGALKKRG